MFIRKKERTTALVVSAVLSGFRAIDTAGQPKHYREELVGEALSTLEKNHNIKREELFIQTKFTALSGQDHSQPLPYDASSRLEMQIQQSFANSLKNLKTTYIDSYILHSPLETISRTITAWRVLMSLQDAGKVKLIGVSNTYDVKILKALEEEGGRKVQVVQNRWFEGNGWDSKVLAYCKENGVQYQSFWTLSGSPTLLIHPTLQKFAQSKGWTPAQAVYRLAQWHGITPLSGTTSEEHMREDAALDTDVELNEGDEKMLRVVLSWMGLTSACSPRFASTSTDIGNAKLNVDASVPASSAGRGSASSNGRNLETASIADATSGDVASSSTSPEISRPVGGEKESMQGVTQALAELNSVLWDKVSVQRERPGVPEKKNSDVPRDLLPLPTLPKLPDYPSPWLTPLKLGAFLTPLYQRRWYVSAEPLVNGKPRQMLSLKKEFKFRKRIWSASFVKEAADLTVRLQHDAVLVLDGLLVTVETHTHDAYAQHPVGKIICPGITLHDVNLALELEKLWIDHCENDHVHNANMLPVETIYANIGPKKRQPKSFLLYALHEGYIAIHQSKRRRKQLVCTLCGGQHSYLECDRQQPISHKKRRKPVCPACLGPHSLNKCPVRASKRPPMPCVLCYEWHWTPDCPQREAERCEHESKANAEREAKTLAKSVETTFLGHIALPDIHITENNGLAIYSSVGIPGLYTARCVRCQILTTSALMPSTQAFKTANDEALLPHDIIAAPERGNPPYTWLSPTDATRYLWTLYKYKWYICRAPDTLPDKPSLALRKELPFDSTMNAQLFFHETLLMTLQEQAEGKLEVRGKYLTYTTYTQHALAPPVGFAETRYDASKSYRPGVTIEDVRIAFKVERAWREYLSFKGLSLSEGLPPPAHIRFRQQNRIPKGQSIYTPSTYAPCVACGGNHSLERCRIRGEIKPEIPCGACGGDHWTIDCPNGAVRCIACGKHHDIRNCADRADHPPPDPCSNCGEKHWIWDCPKPHTCLACHGAHDLRDCPTALSYLRHIPAASAVGSTGQWTAA
ncbi:hypothetical protein NM688_g5466 [Phlebia brevispora]|uniref:Uncharacterized protein n=1 Tax=Phlebia brevispora TaxID=194682 RepID=A0ACC1SVF8_9APHY|nr:hypothetical protein NM688_g5466 [Phlebia brevispora]